MKRFGHWVLLCAAALLLPGLAFAEAKPVAQKGAKDLVFKGDARCTTCHDETEAYPVVDIAKTRHGGVGKFRNMTCSTCHGESNAHADAPSNEKARPRTDIAYGKKAGNTDPNKRSEACMSCHSGDRQMAFWDAGRHKKNDVSCDSCHSVHEARNTPLRKDNPTISGFTTTSRQLEYETCATCHKQIRAQIGKPSRHPLMEGKIKCSSCHNPHGAMSHAMVKNESVNQLCTSCHAEKRGPYMQEHPPVEENCLSCHDSHGSSHAKLLKERVPNICQDCHDWSRHPGTYYSGALGFNNPFSGTTGGPNTRLVARSCLNCHTEIHGSNAPAMRGKYLLR